MSEQLHDRVTEILTDADETSGSLLETSDESAATDLLETADEASELLESTEPRELLEAVGLGTLPDGTEPGSLPEAIAKGDPEHVEDLQRLLKLGKLADRSDDGALEASVDGLQETIDEQATADADKGTESGDGDGESADDAAADDGTADADEESTDDGSEGLEDRLRSAISSSFDEFGDDVRSMQERLEEASSGLTDGDESEGDGAKADADDGGLLGSDEEVDEADTEEDEDDGLLGSKQEGSIGSSHSSRHSTMAPPPSERADMRGPARFSTMPDKN